MVQSECAIAMPNCISYKDEEDDGPRTDITIALDSMNTDECCAVSKTNGNVSCGKHHDPGSAAEYHTAHDSCSPMPDERTGASCSDSSLWPLPPSSLYSSARIQSMINNRSKFKSDLEFEMEYSKVHYSELDPTSQQHHSGEANRKYFEELMLKQDAYQKQLLKINPETSLSDRAGFFRNMDDLVVGEKIGQGAQAEIYEAGDRYVVKVFGDDFALQELEKQWPPGMLNEFHGRYKRAVHLILGATLLKNERFLNRFSFVMHRQWGDLRKLIDLRMVQHNNQGPQFTLNQLKWIMLCIADDMSRLHATQPPILHKDLKAANVLLGGSHLPSLAGWYYAIVADYECSMGVVGTGFWRAPEILQQLKNRSINPILEFTEKGDVYSYGMTCYELVTGHIPFEDHPKSDYDIVINGNRPNLPHDLDPTVKHIITSCWHQNPAQRPSFEDIARQHLPDFESLFDSIRMDGDK